MMRRRTIIATSFSLWIILPFLCLGAPTTEIAPPQSAFTHEDPVSLAGALMGVFSQEWMKNLILAQEWDPTKTNHTFSVRRSLAVGDFEELNALLKDATVTLPPAIIEEEVAGSDLTLDLKKIECNDIRIGDIQIAYSKNSNQKLTFQVNIFELDLKCFVDYKYKYRFLPSGNGEASAETENNSASVSFAFTSPDFTTVPPNAASIVDCETNINISDMDFKGGFIGWLLDQFDDLISNVVEKEINEIACQELDSLATSMGEDFLTFAGDLINQYLGGLGDQDPLAAEKALNPPESVQLLNFKDTGNIIGEWFDQILEQADNLLGNQQEDADGGTDLGVNVFLRDFLLDNEGALTVDVSKILSDGVILLDTHDKLTQTTMTLKAVKCYGLDTLTKFDPLLGIGNYTLQNALKWEYLTMELDIEIKIRPSTLDDAVISNPSNTEVTENMRIDFGIDNVDAVVTLLAGIDQKALGQLALGSILHTDNLFSCFLSSIYDVQLTQLAVQIGNVRNPTLSGFVSPGIDRVVKRSVKALFLMYEVLLLKAAPKFFGTKVKDILNENLIGDYMSNPDSVLCPDESTNVDGFVDFRDLLLEPSIAVLSGGTGEEPYGSLASTLFQMVEDQLKASDSNGMPAINSMVIGSATKAQSGIEGTLHFPPPVVDLVKDNFESDIWKSFAERIELKLYNTSISNLDTIMSPLSLMQPSSEPNLLTNSFRLGPVDGRPLGASMNLLLALEGSDSPFKMRNDIHITLSVPETYISAALLSKIDAEAIMKFPLEDLTNYHCLLATMAAPLLDEYGNRVNPNEESNLALETFYLTLSELSFGVSCDDCTSPGVADLPEILDMLEETGIMSLFRERIQTFAKETLEGDFLQLIIDRYLSEAPKMCPHHESYEEGATLKDYGLPEIEGLSKKSIETFIIGGVMAFNTAVVSFAKGHLSLDEETSPLSGQLALASNMPSNSEMVDWTDIEGSFGTLAATAFDELQNYLKATIEDEETGESDLGINRLLRDQLLGDDGIFRASFDDLIFDLSGVKFTLSGIHVIGLDSLTMFDPLRPFAPQTLQNILVWESLSVELVIEVTGAPETLFRSVESAYMTLSLGMRDIEINLSLLVALSMENLGELELGSLLQTKNILPCLLSALYDVNVPQMMVVVGSIDDPQISGFASEEVQTSIQSSTKAIFDKYRPDILAAIPNIFDGTVRGLLNNLLSTYVNKEFSASCVSLARAYPSFDVVDFRDLFLTPELSRELGGSSFSQYGDLFHSIFEYVNEKLLKTDSLNGVSAVNDLISSLTQAQSDVPGTFAYPGDLMSTDSNIEVGGLKANIQLKASNLRIENLDTAGDPLSLLQPILNDPVTLNSTASFGIASEPLRVSLRMLIALLGDDDMQLRNEVDISLDLNTATVILATLLRVSEESFLTFPLRDVFNLNCWLATIQTPTLDSRGVRIAGSEPSAALTNLVVAIAKVGLNITCVTCTSPEIKELAVLLSSPEGIDDATEAANMVLNYATTLLGGEFLQVKIDRMLNDAAQKCPHSPSYNENPVEARYAPFESPDGKDDSIAFLITIAIVMVCLALVTLILTSVIKSIVSRRNQAWLKTLPRSQILNLHREQAEAEEQKARSHSMFSSEEIPVYTRYLVPVVLVVNIGFFLSGHLSLGASVNIEAQFAGESFTVSNFFDFSMARSTVDIWNAGGKELAILILIFSGIWPYMKQLITLILWFLPTRFCSTNTRGNIFLWLDKLAKWSMVDIFVLVISIAAFRVSIGSPNVAFLTEDFYSVDLMVVPTWGLYANMIAQLLSQVSSHFIIHYHRLIVKATTRVSSNNDDLASSDPEKILATSSHIQDVKDVNEEHARRDELRKHAFIRPHRGDADGLQVRRGVDPAVMVFAFLVVFFVIYGCTVPSFSLEVLGIIGVAVESGQGFDEAVTYHSVFSVVGLLLEEAKFLGTAADSLGIGSLCTLFILTILVVPLIQMVALVCQWFVPLTKKNRKRASNLVEILGAWQYVEVYLIALIVSAWQIGPVSEFMINSYCDGLDDTFSSLVYYGILAEENAQCFKVTATVESGTYVLALGAVMLALLSTFVVKAVVQYNEDTKDANKTEEESTLDIADDDGNIEEVLEKIHPIPVMFTDQFRWLLHRQVGPNNIEREDDVDLMDVDVMFPVVTGIDRVPASKGVQVYKDTGSQEEKTDIEGIDCGTWENSDNSKSDAWSSGSSRQIENSDSNSIDAWSSASSRQIE